MRDHLGNFMMASDLQFARGVLLLDDCEGTCTWDATITDANATVTYETAAAFMGTKGLQLFSGDADPAEDDQVVGHKLFGLPESGLLVMRARIASPDISLWKAISVLLMHQDAAQTYYGEVRFTPADGKVYYSDVGGSMVEIAALLGVQIDGMFVTYELVVDCLAHTYVSVMVNGLRADLADVALYNPAVSTARYAGCSVAGLVAGAAAATLYVDSVYVGEFLHV